MRRSQTRRPVPHFGPIYHSSWYLAGADACTGISSNNTPTSRLTLPLRHDTFADTILYPGYWYHKKKNTWIAFTWTIPYRRAIQESWHIIRRYNTPEHDTSMPWSLSASHLPDRFSRIYSTLYYVVCCTKNMIIISVTLRGTAAADVREEVDWMINENVRATKTNVN